MADDDGGWGTAPTSSSTPTTNTKTSRREADGTGTVADALQRAGQSLAAVQELINALGTGKDSEKLRADLERQLNDATSSLATSETAINALAKTLDKPRLEKIQAQHKELSDLLHSLAKTSKRKRDEFKLLVIEVPTSNKRAQQTGETQIQVTIVKQDATKQIIEERNKEMKQLANDLDGLKEVMQDANQLVVMQGEPITGVQTKVETSKIDVEQGNADLAVAEGYAMSIRVKIAIGSAVLLLIIVGIILLILGVTGVFK